MLGALDHEAKLLFLLPRTLPPPLLFVIFLAFVTVSCRDGQP